MRLPQSVVANSHYMDVGSVRCRSRSFICSSIFASADKDVHLCGTIIVCLGRVCQLETDKLTWTKPSDDQALVDSGLKRQRVRHDCEFQKAGGYRLLFFV